ncbi:MAG: hypothetical protein HPY89_01595 [Pelotomaculum sp.]|nr:hypothetical protein [Pelotomaculum sp.]
MEPAADPLNICGLLNRAAKLHPEKPVAVWPFGPHRREYTNLLEKEGAIAAYPSPKRAARALSILYHYHHVIKTSSKASLFASSAFPEIETSAIRRLLQKAQAKGPEILGADALEIVRSCNIPAILSKAAQTREEAVKAALEIGLPVAMKLNSPDVSHKSDIGGVRLNLKTVDEVASAYEVIMKNAAAKVPGARLDGVLLQEYRSTGTEVIIGFKRDRQFGPVVVYGMGGIFTEVFRDVSFRIAPVDYEEAMDMIGETKSREILKGARGRAPADMEALAASIVRISRLAARFPEIAEMDINPLLAGPEGVVALDARLSLARPDTL